MLVFLIILLWFLIPLGTFAFDAGEVPHSASTLSLFELIDIIFSVLWQVKIAFAVFSFITAALLFISAQGNPERIASAKRAVIFGAVGLVLGFLSYSLPFIIRLVIFFR